MGLRRAHLLRTERRSASTARLERPDLALSQPQDKTANGVKMPNVQEVNYNLPETGVAKVPPFAVQARSDGFFARSVGSVPPTAAALRAAARVPRLARGATKPPYVTTSSRTGLPSWRRTVRLLSESGSNSVDKGARRRAPARGLPAGQGLAVLRTVGRLGTKVRPVTARQLGIAAQRQRAADRVAAEQQRCTQRKEAAERAKEEQGDRSQSRRARARSSPMYWSLGRENQ